MIWLTILKYLYHKWPWIPVCSAITICPSSFMTYQRFVTRVSQVDQELLTLLQHLSSHPIFSGVYVAWSLVFCTVFCRSLFVLLAIVLCIVSPLIYSCWLPFCTLYCLPFDLQLLVTILYFVLSLLWFTAVGYHFGIFKHFFSQSYRYIKILM